MTDPSWPELYFARHGETDWNAEARYQGARDIPLNARGRRQADENGALLARIFARHARRPEEFGWYVSPLSRARETMERIRARFSVPLPEPVIDERLVEVSFGEYEGRRHADLAGGLMAIAGERDASFWSFRPPGGESYADLALRVADFGRSLTGPAVVVAHGGILRVLRRLIEGLPPEKVVNWFPPQDSILHFEDGKSTVYPAGASWDD